MDADALIHIARPDDASTRICTTSFMRYGPEIGVPRICDLFESYALKVSFFVPAWCAEEHPRVIERMIEGGHEIAHHGYMHESPSLNTRDRETYWTVRALDSLEHLTGTRPVGYRAPLYDYSRHTTAILAELGFRYESSLMGDDLPYVLRSRSGDLLELPVDWACDDWNQFCHLADIDFVMPIQTPRHAFEVYRSEFEGQYEIGGFWQIVWHPPDRPRGAHALCPQLHRGAVGKGRRLADQLHCGGRPCRRPDRGGQLHAARRYHAHQEQRPSHPGTG